MKENERSFSFTARGLDAMLETVDHPEFQEQDAGKIIAALKAQMRVVPFCEYLKRYVYLRSGMVGSYLAVPAEEYRNTVCDAFYATGTPVSMKKMSTRVSVRVSSWLQQESVRRSAVLLLGFGLSMSEEDVNEFLTRALHGHRLDPEDPTEAICAYCYRHGYGFLKMRQLAQVLKAAEEGEPLRPLIDGNHPAGREASREVADEDEVLIREILDRKLGADPEGQRARTRRHFQELYREAAGKAGPKHPADTAERGTGRSPSSDIEDILYASVPREKHGNLLAEASSSLMEVIAGKRLSRQRLSRLLHEEEEPSRYDLMTLNFLIFAKEKIQDEPKLRCFAYIRETSRILTECGYGEVYPADPYECFLVMCMLSVDPLGTFSDVLEISYAGAKTGEGSGTDA